MPIVSSQIIGFDKQADGRISVTEKHVDQTAKDYLMQYVSDVNSDFTAILLVNANSISANLIENEIRKNIQEITLNGSLAPISLVHASVAQLATAVRFVYKNTTDRQVIMIGDFLSSQSDARLQSAFGLTLGQVTTLRTNKLTPQSIKAAEIRAEAGQ